MDKPKFYIQKYPTATTTFEAVDIEATFDCVYCSISGISTDGNIKNIYTEKYSNAPSLRVYLPDADKIQHEENECTLKLLFKKHNYQTKSDAFYEYIKGHKIEWFDTFRNRYVTLLLTKQPTVPQEKLYGSNPFMAIEYKFTNIFGKRFKTTQIP